jgi:hypothetical protein
VTAQPAPTALRVAAALAALEGLALVGAALLYALRGVLGDAESAAGAELGALLIAGVGALLLAAARGLLHRRRWARSPVVVVQLLAVPVGLSLVGGGVLAAGLAVLALAAATIGALASPQGRAGLDG